MGETSPAATVGRFALVVPPTKHTSLSLFDCYRFAPIEGAASIATVAANTGFAVRVFDLRWETYTVSELATTLSRDYDFVGITTPSDSFKFVKDLTAALKSLDSEQTLVLGGSLVSSAPETMLANTNADVAVLGEGEATFGELLLKLKDHADTRTVNGLAVRTKNGVSFTQSRDQIDDLDVLPTPDLSLWRSISEKRTDGIYYSTARGCPHNCSFCSRSIRKLTSKSCSRVRDDLTHARDAYGVRNVQFVDLTMNYDTPRFRALCETVGELGLRWDAMLRCDTLQPEDLRMMKSSGCDVLRFGLESFSQGVLDKNSKHITVGQIDRAVGMAQDAGLIVAAWFIVGLPGETRESLLSTKGFIERTRVIPRVHFLIPLPGTATMERFYARGYFEGELAVLEFLSDRGYGDDLLNITDVQDEEIRDAYNALAQIAQERLAQVVVDKPASLIEEGG